MATQSLPLPDDARRAVREATWPNRQAEAAAVHDADQAVFDKARFHEAYLVRTGEALESQIGDQLATADDTLGVSAELANGVRHGTVELTPETAVRYKEVRASLEASIVELEYLRGQAESAATRCEDPYGQVQMILSKFAALRAGRSYVR